MYDKEIGMYYLIARYYNPEHGAFLSVDPDPGDEDDPITMNGYTYGDNNPVMKVDPDGHAAWLAINAVIAGYNAYSAYKSGKGWKGVAIAAGTGLVGGAAFKGAKLAYNAYNAYNAYKAGKFSKTYRLANKVSKNHGGTIKRAKGNGWVVNVPQGQKHSYTVRVMNAGSGNRNKPYYRVSHSKYGSFDKYGNTTSDRAKTHVNLSRKSYKQISNIITKKH